MTLTKVMTMALRRSGFSSSVSSYVDHARDYMNLFRDDIVSRHPWRWLRKKSITVTTTDGQRVDELPSDVAHPLTFWNKTDNHPIEVIGPNSVYAFDPDDDEEGPVWGVSVTGLNATNGTWEVSWVPIPDTTGDVILLQYLSKVNGGTDYTSSDDSASLDGEMPSWAQHAAIHYISSGLKGMEGDYEGEAEDLDIYEQRIDQAILLDLKMDGNRRTRMRRRRQRSREVIEFRVQEGTL